MDHAAACAEVAARERRAAVAVSERRLDGPYERGPARAAWPRRPRAVG